MHTQMKDAFRQILWAALLVTAQALVFDNLQLRGGISTFVTFEVYYFYILLLPVATPQVNLLLGSFLLGFGMDLFADTLGIHAAACLLAGFVRIQTAHIFWTGKEQDQRLRPSIRQMGVIPFFYYTLILSFCFHFALCCLETFTFYKFYFTLLRIVASSIASAVIMVFVQTLFGKK